MFHAPEDVPRMSAIAASPSPPHRHRRHIATHTPSPRRIATHTPPHHLAAAMASASARCEPFPAFPLTPGLPVCPVQLSAASASARCEPFPAFPLTPGLSVCPVQLSAASASARCEPFSVFPLTPRLSVCPVQLSAASASVRCEPFPVFPLTPGRHFARQPGAVALQTSSPVNR